MQARRPNFDSGESREHVLYDLSIYSVSDSRKIDFLHLLKNKFINSKISIKFIPSVMPVAFDIPRISSLYSCGIFSNKAGFKKKVKKIKDYNWETK